MYSKRRSRRTVSDTGCDERRRPRLHRQGRLRWPQAPSRRHQGWLRSSQLPLRALTGSAAFVAGDPAPSVRVGCARRSRRCALSKVGCSQRSGRCACSKAGCAQDHEVCTIPTPQFAKIEQRRITPNHKNDNYFSPERRLVFRRSSVRLEMTLTIMSFSPCVVPHSGASTGATAASD